MVANTFLFLGNKYRGREDGKKGDIPYVSADYLNQFYYRLECCYDYVAFDHVQWCS